MENTSIKIDPVRMKRCLRQMRMSVPDLAARLKCNPQTIYRLQQDRGATSMTFLDNLARVVGRDIVAEMIVNDDDRSDFLNPIHVGGDE